MSSAHNVIPFQTQIKVHIMEFCMRETAASHDLSFYSREPLKIAIFRGNSENAMFLFVLYQRVKTRTYHKIKHCK